MNYSKPLKTVGIALGAASLAGLVSTGAMADGSYTIEQSFTFAYDEKSASAFCMLGKRYEGVISQSVEFKEPVPPEQLDALSVDDQYVIKHIINVGLKSCQDDTHYRFKLQVNGRVVPLKLTRRGKGVVTFPVVVKDSTDDIKWTGPLEIGFLLWEPEYWTFYKGTSSVDITGNFPAKQPNSFSLEQRVK